MPIAPNPPASVDELEEALAQPSAQLLEDFATIDGDIMVLGAGGKMGPTLCMLAARARDIVGGTQKILAVSRWSDSAAAERLAAAGVEIVTSDLSESSAWNSLDIPEHVVYMIGKKFGTGTEPWLTWETNSYLAGRACEYLHDRSVAMFSSGNVYPYVAVRNGGSLESDALGPVGEYAQSCVARERHFQGLAASGAARVSILRLTYAVETRYGVIADIGSRILAGAPVDVTTGIVNVCWQGWANEVALRSLLRASSPANVINVAGPEAVSTAWIARELGRLLGTEPVIEGTPADTAMMSNAVATHGEYGYPTLPLDTVLQWTASWLKDGLPMLGKPTHFAVRDGAY
jgi:nucleoside-diphosphate-sugar epimerase